MMTLCTAFTSERSEEANKKHVSQHPFKIITCGKSIYSSILVHAKDSI